MSAFAAILSCTKGRWRASEVSVADCESVADMGELLDEFGGEVRLLAIEQDDEYAAIIRCDAGEDELRVFLSDGHSADSYPLAELIAEELDPVTLGGADGDDGIDEDDDDVPPVHESAPLGDASVVEDLGTAPADLIAMCLHQGTLPIDVLVAVCEKAGCIDQFDAVRG